MKTERFNLNQLRNEEHYSFNTEIIALIEKYNADNLGIRAPFDAYRAAFAIEGSAVEVIRKSLKTAQLAEADQARDEVFSGMVNIVRGNLNHFNSSFSVAAQEINIVLEHFGNVAPLPYNQETGAIINLLKELKSSCVNELNTLSLNDWVAELENRNNAFITISGERYSESAEVTSTSSAKEARIEVDKCYRKVLDYLDALMLINGENNYKAFVGELNARSLKYEATIAQRQGKSGVVEEAENVVSE